MSRPPRLPPPPDTPDLNVLASRVRELNAKSALAGVAAARLVWQARALFQSNQPWEQWAADTIGLGRRSVYRWARAAECHLRLDQDGLIDAIPSDVLSIMLLDAVAIIPSDRLLQFLDTIDLVEASIEEIAAAAEAFMGKAVHTSGFVRYRGPSADRLAAGLNSEEARKNLDPIAELDLALAHIKRMQAVREKLSPQARDVAVRYFNNLAIELLQEAKA